MVKIMNNMTANGIKIRRATEADYEAINSLYYLTYSLYHQNIPESYKKTPRRILPKGTFLNMIEDDRNAFVAIAIAEVNDQIVGILYATIESEDSNKVVHGYHRVSVDEVSVLPSFAGRGIGSLLLGEAERWAKQKKIN